MICSSHYVSTDDLSNHSVISDHFSSLHSVSTDDL